MVSYERRSKMVPRTKRFPMVSYQLQSGGKICGGPRVKRFLLDMEDVSTIVSSQADGHGETSEAVRAGAEASQANKTNSP